MVTGSEAFSAVNWARFRLGVPWALTGGEIDEPCVLGSAKRDTIWGHSMEDFPNTTYRRSLSKRYTGNTDITHHAQ